MMLCRLIYSHVPERSPKGFNTRIEKSTCQTRLSLDGDVTIGDFDTADWVQYNGQPAVNNSSSVIWKTKLKPGEKFEPSVRYHYFTRH
jgi:hypothetical protein